MGLRALSVRSAARCTAISTMHCTAAVDTRASLRSTCPGSAPSAPLHRAEDGTLPTPSYGDAWAVTCEAADAGHKRKSKACQGLENDPRRVSHTFPLKMERMKADVRGKGGTTADRSATQAKQDRKVHATPPLPPIKQLLP